MMKTDTVESGLEEGQACEKGGHLQTTALMRDRLLGKHVGIHGGFVRTGIVLDARASCPGVHLVV